MNDCITKVKLGELFQFCNGKASTLAPNGQYPVYGSNGIIGYSSDYNYEQAIILGRVGAFCGSVKHSLDRFWATDNTIILVPKEEQSLKYWYYRLSIANLRNYAGGAAQPLITHSTLKPIELSAHSSAKVQKKIADILSAYDDLIEVNRRSIQLLEESARRLYKEWFVHFRFPNHEKVKMVDGLPEGWKRVPFNTVVQINPTERVANTDEIRSFPMSSLSTSQMTIEMNEVEIREKPTGVKFRNGDTLVARITPCLQNGKTGFVQCLQENEVACGSTEFIVLRSKDLCPEMVYCIARTDEFRDKAIQSMVGASGRQRVQDECFGKIFIHLPSKDVLENFEMLTRPIWEKIRILDHEINDAMIARDRILPRLMSGKVVID